MSIIYYTPFDSPFGAGIIGALEDKICWLSFKDDGNRFKKFIENYIDAYLSRLTGKDFARFKAKYPPAARLITSKNISIVKDETRFTEALDLIRGYFGGEKIDFSILDVIYLEGTSFQQRVWDSLRKIEYGKTISYKQLAGMAGNPNSFRAAGSANSKNLIPLIIPCHRVIKSDGSPGGYSAGLDIKEKLLEIENIRLK